MCMSLSNVSLKKNVDQCCKSTMYGRARIGSKAGISLFLAQEMAFCGLPIERGGKIPLVCPALKETCFSLSMHYLSNK